MTNHRFEVTVDEDALDAFAKLSGDNNPLHTDAAYAADTPYRKRVLHGAYAAGLVSRMAGMHLPGTSCLLHDMRLKFISPVIPPVTVVVEGTLVRENAEGGEVEVVISDAVTSRRYTEARYTFGHHATPDDNTPSPAEPAAFAARGKQPKVLVTGASGGIGSALSKLFGNSVIAISRDDAIDTQEGRQALIERLDGQAVSGAVHCGWPLPDNQRLVRLRDPQAALDAGLTQPLSQAVGLASLMSEFGADGSTLILIGSTAANPGRHFWRAPIYTLAKSTIPTLTNIFGMELAASKVKCVGVMFDALDGGMSGQLSAAAKVANADRSPFGRMMTVEEAADTVAWLLENPTFFLSGATVDLSGGAIP